MAISYGIRLWLERMKKGAVRKLSRDAREVARRLVGEGSPALASGESSSEFQLPTGTHMSTAINEESDS